MVTRFLAGDEYAFTQIVDRYGSLLLRTAYLLVHDEETARDIVQDSFILAWKNVYKLRERIYLRAWLLKIVVNQATSFKRQVARRTALFKEQFVQYTTDQSVEVAEAPSTNIDEALDMAQAISKLPLNQRSVLVLFYYHKMTMPEIAETLGVAENTLRKRLQSAHEKLRRVLQSEASYSQLSMQSAEYLPAPIKYRGETQ
ncbi:putative alternative RNA polymerase sigma factor SigM [Dictyobacter kobayashii]|uniref:Putative alternative RNA polymerase sigma factor SigM n=2 Tax=Dictyobacter kobayashii TaxID=2014872 RepID=A0A402ADL5_9CHLR|nr:putative alternative RNA polymerase sigma factor SigM [Dictyobacter kobayashii]